MERVLSILYFYLINYKKNTKTPVFLIHKGLALIPPLNLLFKLFSFYSADKTNFKKKIKLHNIYFIPGGVKDMYNMETNIHGKKETINIPYGWMKYSLQEGATIVPIYNFDETSILKILSLPFLNIRKRIQSYTYLPIIFPDICDILYLYKHKKITSAIGKPIQLPKIENPTKKDIFMWHRKYCKRLIRLINKHKKSAGYPELVVTIKELEDQRFFLRRRRECK